MSSVVMLERSCGYYGPCEPLGTHTDGCLTCHGLGYTLEGSLEALVESAQSLRGWRLEDNDYNEEGCDAPQGAVHAAVWIGPGAGFHGTGTPAEALIAALCAAEGI